MKISPIYRQSKTCPQIECKIIHTGQHYDYAMSQAFFDDLEIPQPDVFLEAGSGSHARQTAHIMTAFEQVCLDEKPDWVVVVGDVNSTLACTIAAEKLCIKVAHVEAGLRSGDMAMPEEINRLVTDSISDLFFVTEQSALDHLLEEGKPQSQIHFVGHVMINNLLYQKEKLPQLDLGVSPAAALKDKFSTYGFVTLHRPSNVDQYEVLRGIVGALNEIADSLPLFFPVHPRTKKQLQMFELQLSDRIRQLPPLGFNESLLLWKDARVVLTDSGGLQEETTALGVPCVTLRENTERPITLEKGSNILAGNKPEKILQAFRQSLSLPAGGCEVPPLWDGRAAERIWKVLVD